MRYFDLIQRNSQGCKASQVSDYMAFSLSLHDTHSLHLKFFLALLF